MIIASLFPCRLCYFTAGSTSKKFDFMRELNSSFRQAGLQCSFSDKELSEFLQYKKQNTAALLVKFGVLNVGLQENGSWVLGPCAYISEDGEEMSLEQSK